MKYAVLIYDRADLLESLSEHEREQLLGEYLALARQPRVTASACLQGVASATTVQVNETRTLVTDGPYADTKEVFGGFYVLDVDGPEEALEFAARVPAARMGGAVEVRPLIHLRGEPRPPRFSGRGSLRPTGVPDGSARSSSGQ